MQCIRQLWTPINWWEKYSQEKDGLRISLSVIQKSKSKGPTTYEKMSNLSSDQEDANESHNEVSFHIHQTGNNSRVTCDLWQDWGCGNSCEGVANEYMNYPMLKKKKKLANAFREQSENFSIKILKSSLTWQFHSQDSMHRNRSKRKKEMGIETHSSNVGRTKRHQNPANKPNAHQ